MGMDGYKRLLDFNERWVAERTGERPDYFARLKDNQDPEYVWIGAPTAGFRPRPSPAASPATSSSTATWRTR